MTRTRGDTAPPPPSGRRLRCDTTRQHHSSIRQTQPTKTTDAKWSHFKPSRRGQRKPSFLDVLSYELSCPAALVVDSGTYAYTSDIEARLYLRSTAAHNSLVVDGAELNPIDERQVFRLRRVAIPRVHA
ncbi:MAG: heparinase II/III-family protein, partial [Actinobacteria bacterium]|nr:heparinase II/III-family protein [Actinomycetota bacterium]